MTDEAEQGGKVSLILTGMQIFSCVSRLPSFCASLTHQANIAPVMHGITPRARANTAVKMRRKH